jgi:hypothetical protein
VARVTRAARLFSLTTVAAVTVAIALATATYRLPGFVRSAYDAITAPQGVAEARDLGFVFGWQSRLAATRAAKLLPRDATYTVVTGDVPPPKVYESEGIVPFLRYWLLPRRYTPDPAQAEWVITYHHPSETVGLPYEKEHNLADYVNAFRVTR